MALNINNESNDNAQDYDFSSISDEEMERLKAKRKERYTEYSQMSTNPNLQKNVSKKTVIAVMAFIFLYYISILILRMMKLINLPITLGCCLAGVIVTVIVFYIYSKKNGL